MRGMECKECVAKHSLLHSTIGHFPSPLPMPPPASLLVLAASLLVVGANHYDGTRL